jgi:hypothetical protein
MANLIPQAKSIKTYLVARRVAEAGEYAERGETESEGDESGLELTRARTVLRIISSSPRLVRKCQDSP